MIIKRMNRFHLVIAGLLALGIGSVIAACARNAYAESPVILSADQALVPGLLKAEPVPLDLETSNRTTAGKLHYLGGLSLKSGDTRFGGLSSMQISPDGRQMLTISDRGYWISASLDYRDGNLVGAHNLMIAPLLDLEGQPLNASKDFNADAEALTELPGSGIVISFEGQHRLWHYGAGFDDFMMQKSATPLPLPVDVAEAIAGLPGNGGIESMATLKDGRLVAIAEEGGKQDGIVPGWIIGETSIAAFHYEATDNFRPTDLAALPNGDILVLERRLTLLQGLAARVKRIAAADLRNGTTVRAEAIATLSYPYNVDNMEGISTREGPNGETFVYLVSDDNYLTLQRTLLMMFELKD